MKNNTGLETILKSYNSHNVIIFYFIFLFLIYKGRCSTSEIQSNAKEIKCEYSENDSIVYHGNTICRQQEGIAFLKQLRSNSEAALCFKCLYPMYL